jgi:hypothetical protein
MRVIAPSPPILLGLALNRWRLRIFDLVRPENLSTHFVNLFVAFHTKGPQVIGLDASGQWKFEFAPILASNVAVHYHGLKIWNMANKSGKERCVRGADTGTA